MRRVALKVSLLALPLAIAPGTAHATAGMFCTTGGKAPIELSLVIGRVTGGPLISAGLRDNGPDVANSVAQWWLDGAEMRLLLIDPQAEREEVELRARRRGDDYVGRLTRAGRTRPVRCEESG